MINTFGHLINEYYLRKFRANAEQRRARLESIKTPEDFKRYQAEIREKVKQSFGLPTEKTPLQPRVCKTLTGEGFRVENVIYHSRPQLPVTANLYIPDQAANAPAVLFLCGHSTNGKAADVYQKAILNLVREGYVVLCPDPSGQGERSMFIDAPNAEITGVLYATTREHNMIAKQMLLVGEYYTSWCLWDAVRSLDYLLSRPEVNPAQVCVTGNSGGGNMSAFLTAVDDRLFAAAPSCYISTWVHHLENEEPCDAEQEPQFFVGLGCEMGDLLLANAPRPVLVLGQKNDFFDERGARETAAEVKRIYSILGVPDQADVFIGPCDHGYHRENREAMVKFFNKMLGLPAPAPEPEEMKVFTDEQLQCTPRGQVHYLEGERSFISFVQELADKFKNQRPKLPLPELRQKLAQLLKIEPVPVPHYRVLRPIIAGDCGYQLCSRYAMETEPEMLAMLKFLCTSRKYTFHFPEDLEHVTLYVPHQDSLDEMLRINEFSQGEGWFGVDIRGLGDMMSLACNPNTGHSAKYGRKVSCDPLYAFPDMLGRDFFAYYCDDYHYSACGLMLGELYLTGRVRDVLSAFKLLQAYGVKKIDLVARGQGSVPAVLAALLSGAANKVTLIDAPPSFDSMVRKQIIPYPQSMMPTGILQLTDLPEIYEHLGATHRQIYFP